MSRDQGEAPATWRIALPCQSPGCRLPLAYILVQADGRLFLELRARHWGEKHSGRICLDTLPLGPDSPLLAQPDHRAMSPGYAPPHTEG